MSTSKKQILSDELILSYIEGNLPEEESKRVEKLIRSNDKHFIRFSSLYASYREMEEVKLEVVPDMLIERAKAEFQLDKKKKAEGFIPENLLQSLRGIKDFIVVQKVRLAVVGTTMATLLMIGRVALIDRSPEMAEDTASEQKPVPEWAKPQDDEMFMAKDNLEPDFKSMMKKIKMPDFSGMEKTEITDSLKILGLKYRILDKGNEFSQTPKAGTIISQSDSVTITIKTIY